MKNQINSCGGQSLVDPRPQKDTNAKQAWDDVFDTSSDTSEDSECVSCLSNPISSYVSKHGFFEITLNYPRTATFIKMLSTKQKILYAKLFRTITHCISPPHESKYVYEYCKSGHVHLHGYMIPSIKSYYILGYIADMVKTYVSLLPKKYSKYVDSCMFSKYNRYRSASICIQYSDKLDEFNRWLMYMRKTILINNERT